MSFDLFMCVGGYWTTDDAYHGGEIHNVGEVSSEGFQLSLVSELIEHLGNASQEVVHYAVGSGAMTLLVVREDDPYIGKHVGCSLRQLGDYVGHSNDGDGNSSQLDVDGEGDEDDENASQSETENHSDGANVEIEEKKYRNIRLGQEYKTIDSFKSAIAQYALKNKRDIMFEKSDSKRVIAVCSEKQCPWRISASINSSSTRMVVRTYNDEHDCTWQGRVSLLTNARIADIYLEEFRIDPDITAKQLQKKAPETQHQCFRNNLAYFTEFSKCDAVENNLGESFNAAIRIPRTNPVVEMLEDIRRYVMVSNDKKRSQAEKLKGDYTPKSRALLDQQIEKAKNCSPLSCGLGDYEVGYFNDRLERNGPIDPKSKISQWFIVEKLRRCYLNGLRPVNGMNMWRVTTAMRVKPPPYKKPPGRPPGKMRKRDKSEPRPGKVSKRGTKIHCGTCGQEGHNKLHSKNAPVPKPAKRPPGRPRKTHAVATLISEVGSQNQLLGSQSQPQPYEDLPSLSSAFPRKGRGRPRKNQNIGGSSSQPCPSIAEPNYGSGQSYIPKEGYGVSTSLLTGDDYIHVGRRVTDTRDNTVLPSSLYQARERKKLAIVRGGSSRGRVRSPSK